MSPVSPAVKILCFGRPLHFPVFKTKRDAGETRRGASPRNAAGVGYAADGRHEVPWLAATPEDTHSSCADGFQHGDRPPRNAAVVRHAADVRQRMRRRGATLRGLTTKRCDGSKCRKGVAVKCFGRPLRWKAPETKSGDHRQPACFEGIKCHLTPRD
jgi:hypothetical protein